MNVLVGYATRHGSTAQIAERMVARLNAQAPPIGVGERMVRHLPVAQSVLTPGDFRDWAAIDSWADEIAIELRSIPA
jgi:menaquinone-dependent protoporphyrinogen IX oxidase